jgi:hypothetical protein
MRNSTGISAWHKRSLEQAKGRVFESVAWSQLVEYLTRNSTE